MPAIRAAAARNSGGPLSRENRPRKHAQQRRLDDAVGAAPAVVLHCRDHRATRARVQPARRDRRAAARPPCATSGAACGPIRPSPRTAGRWRRSRPSRARPRAPPGRRRRPAARRRSGRRPRRARSGTPATLLRRAHAALGRRREDASGLAGRRRPRRSRPTRAPPAAAARRVPRSSPSSSRACAASASFAINCRATWSAPAQGRGRAARRCPRARPPRPSGSARARAARSSRSALLGVRLRADRHVSPAAIERAPATSSATPATSIFAAAPRRGRDADDEARRGHDPVVGAEHRGAQPADPFAPMTLPMSHGTSRARGWGRGASRPRLLRGLIWTH